MSEIKPVAWAFAQDWTKFQADRRECRLLPNFYYGEDMSLSSGFAALYDQQAIDTLQYRLDTSNLYGLQCDKDISDLLTRVESAEAEADALRKDAQRYRWLRDSSNPIATQTVGEFGDQELDEAIDAYIKDSE